MIDAASAAPETPPAPRPPRPWLAALLSLVSPGLGHLYLWRPGAALFFWVLFFVLSTLAILGFVQLDGLVLPAGALAAVLVGTLAIDVAIAVRAFRTARERSAPRRPSRGLLALALLAWYVAVSFPQHYVQEWVERNFVEAYRIPSGAMEPTILVGDYLFVRARGDAKIERGALHTFRRDGEIILKRVVGLPGDTLAMRDGALIRNGRPVVEPYARTEGPGYGPALDFAWQRDHLVDSMEPGHYVPTADDWGPLVVPPESVFVLGDNRHESRDSRFTGPVAEADVLGQPTQVYFSRDPQAGIRWGRIGLRLD